MEHLRQFYIDGEFCDAAANRQLLKVIDPSTEQPIGEVALASEGDVNRAIDAAAKALVSYRHSSREERIRLLKKVLETYEAHSEELAQAVSKEMGAPIKFAREAQVPAGSGHLQATIEALEEFEFETPLTRGTGAVRSEPIGVVGLITPWNWPLNQIACKVGPALAAGCTMVLKPSELTPLSAAVFAKIMHKAGVPAGVFNLVQGSGEVVGTVLSKHPKIAMVSFTGSLRAGALVAKNAADTVKRVVQELGGKSANILLPSVKDWEKVVGDSVRECMLNSGQCCDGPTRLLAPRSHYELVCKVAKQTAESLVVGPPSDTKTDLGPLANETQWFKVQELLRSGEAEHARVLTGGSGRAMSKGYFAKTTIFADVAPHMRVAREEIFGPVLCILPYETVEEAVRVANDTDYGLAAYVQGDFEEAKKLVPLLEAGTIYINHAGGCCHAPFGGWKLSGNGREYGVYGMQEYMELKTVLWNAPTATA